MKSVGEVMAIGRTFQESFQKALRGLETGIDGLSERSTDRDEIIDEIGNAGPERILFLADAFRIGMTLDEIFEETAIDPWFLAQIEDLIQTERRWPAVTWPACPRPSCASSSRRAFPTAVWPSC
jgi:carbamoyl-phosphate synthase large subunit